MSAAVSTSNVSYTVIAKMKKAIKKYSVHRLVKSVIILNVYCSCSVVVGFVVRIISL